MKKIYNTVFIAVAIFSFQIWAQNNSEYEEFINTLPESVKEDVNSNINSDEDTELDKLFRADTSLEKNEAILKNIRQQLDALDKKMNSESKNSKARDELPIFGDDFFSSSQSTFMPINLPNNYENYIADVGDEFLIMLSNKSKEIRSQINRDGTISIPEYGKITVAGLKFKDLVNVISEFVNSKTLGVDAFVTLDKLRDIQVLIVGNIENPGLYTVSGSSNALHLINIAGGISNNGSMRSIQIKRDGKLLRVLDLYDILIFGNFETDLPLKSGDTVLVPPASYHIPITGGISNPAIYEFLPGETIKDAIDFAGGFSSNYSGYDEINIERLGVEKVTNMIININGGMDLKLQPRDAIKVPMYKPTINVAKTVTVKGEVKIPGTYVINDSTTLLEILNQAGGFKNTAYPYGGALFRKSNIELEKEFAELNYSKSIEYLISTIGRQTGYNITGNELSIIIEQLRSGNFTGRLVTEFNLNKLSNNPSYNILLEDGDEIIVPQLNKTVYLLGGFRNPTNVTYQPEFGIDDYLKMAGDLIDGNSDLLVIDPDGKSLFYKKSKFFRFGDEPTIYPGSIIYAQKELGINEQLLTASFVAPVLSNIALTIASLNSLSN